MSDFNELDRHLADCGKVFNYLNAIKQIESDHWSINSKSNQVTNYVQLWNDLSSIYLKLNQNFRKKIEDTKVVFTGKLLRILTPLKFTKNM